MPTPRANTATTKVSARDLRSFILMMIEEAADHHVSTLDVMEVTGNTGAPLRRVLARMQEDGLLVSQGLGGGAPRIWSTPEHEPTWVEEVEPTMTPAQERRLEWLRAFVRELYGKALSSQTPDDILLAAIDLADEKTGITMVGRKIANSGD